MRKSLPQVSVGIPTFNAGLWIAATVRSVLAQTFTNWELIVIDDGSSDSTVKILNSMTDERIRVFSDGKRKGTSARYNEIVRRALAPYVAILDHDDLMFPTRLESQLKILMNNPEVDAVGSGAYVIDGDSNLIGIRAIAPLDTSYRSIVSRGLLCHTSMTARRDWLLQFPYDESLRRLGDQDLWCRSCRTSVFRNISTPQLYYRDITTLSFKKYLRSMSEQVHLLARHGYPKAGRIWTTYQIACQVLKAAVYCVVCLAGAGNWIRRAHNGVLPASEKERALAGLNSIYEQDTASQRLVSSASK